MQGHVFKAQRGRGRAVAIDVEPIHFVGLNGEWHWEFSVVNCWFAENHFPSFARDVLAIHGTLICRQILLHNGNVPTSAFTHVTCEGNGVKSGLCSGNYYRKKTRLNTSLIDLELRILIHQRRRGDLKVHTKRYRFGGFDKVHQVSSRKEGSNSLLKLSRKALKGWCSMGQLLFSFLFLRQPAMDSMKSRLNPEGGVF